MAASLPHQYYSDYTNIYTELFGLAARADACSSEETSQILFNNYAAMINMVPSMSTTCDQLNSPVSVASFPEQFGVSDCMAVPTLPEYDTGLCDFAACKNYCGGSELITPAYNSVASDNWVTKDKPITKVEETVEVKVGRYSVEEKKHRILRYLQKRSQRNFNKTIKYACRKTLADKRVRVRGRFAKNNEPNEDEMEMKMKMYANYNYDQQVNYSMEDAFKVRYDEDDLLQAAMANFAHFPYFAS